MSRLKIALCVAVLIPILVWGGFRIWLVQQEPQFRASIEAFSPLEFVFVLRDTFFPAPLEDRAGFGRRDPAGRGRSPWVMRSSLDGRPRMISLALAPELWLAYSTETASIHQLWRGALDFTGAVFDAQHGVEPISTGSALLRRPQTTAWRVRENDRWQPARVQWRGHGFDPDSGALWLRYELADAAGATRLVTEWPERIGGDERLGLERRFTALPATGPAVALAVDTQAATLETDLSPNDENGESLLALTGGADRIVQWFDAPGTPIDREPSTASESDVWSAHDCHTCHNERERIVGPAWSEIALRYEGANPTTTAAQLATRILEGSSGQWGPVAMTPHAELEREVAEDLARRILATEPAEAPTPPIDDANATWQYGFATEPAPETLHPSLSTTPIDTDAFTPRVGGLAWLPDGRIGGATWDRDGAVYAVEGWSGSPGAVRIERIAEGLQEPLGLAVVGDDLYVMQKQELTQLVDVDGDGWIDEYRTVTNAWSTTSNFHEFGFGFAQRDGALYGALSVCVLSGGKSCRQQTRDRGKVFRLSPETGELAFIASGLRTPNGLTTTPDGRLLVTDNQGDWLPASKLIEVEPGGFYGWRAPGDERDHGPVVPPALWLPQNEIGNSPTQPLVLTRGPYAGHVVFGDVFNGGLKRAFLEEVGGRLQGAAFHFTGGLRGPVNRLLELPEGGMVAGQVGSRGNWGEFGKQWYGIELLHFGNRPAFEPMRVAATPEGFDVHFSRAIAADLAVAPGHFRLWQWFYVPSALYGGPKYDVSELSVRAVDLSPDRRIASLAVDGLAAGHVVYLQMDRELRSTEGETLWVNEAWYTLNARPAVASGPPATPATTPAHATNTLSDAERDAGWQLLFDGESFAGWKLYGADDDAIEGWVIEDAALKFTRDVSFLGLVWNHLNPFSRPALDLMTKERFADFELSLDWKITAGGNSGIFYLVPDEEAPLSWETGLEMQVLDDDRHADGQITRRRAGDLYDLAAGRRRAVRPVGEWNTARIRVTGDRIEHWLNGEKTVDITRGTPEWDRAIAASKFAGVDGFGLARRGHIALQDHGDVVWYRNIKLRPSYRKNSGTQRTSASGISGRLSTSIGAIASARSSAVRR